jgi:hypothetical protein
MRGIKLEGEVGGREGRKEEGNKGERGNKNTSA